jgi:hypothetical protein
MINLDHVHFQHKTVIYRFPAYIKLNHYRQTVCQVELGFLCFRIYYKTSQKPLWHNYGLCARLLAHSRFIVLINF